jgi:hypothetical protein
MLFADVSPLEILFTQFGLLGFALWLAFVFFNSCFNRWLDASEREHERKLKSLEDEHIKRLELLNKRDEIRFSDLHKKRAERIEALYHLLKEFFYTASEFMPGVKTDAEKLKKARIALNELVNYFDINDIYFSRGHGDGIWMFINNIKELVTDKLIAGEQLDVKNQAEVIERHLKRWGKFQKDSPRVLGEIREEFRRLLGVDNE